MKVVASNSPTDMLNKIKNELSKRGLGTVKLHIFDSLDSTNSEAKRYARSCPDKTPAVFIAREQTGGRGRLGRSFLSQRDAGLYISFLLYPRDKAEDSLIITARAAVATARATERVAKISPEIKWVNDIYVKGKKLAGILCEGELCEDGTLAFMVVGIGINMCDRSLGEELDKIATNIEREAGQRVSLESLAAELIYEIFSYNGDFLKEYRRRCTMLGKEITVKPLFDKEYTAKAVEISDTGGLIIEKNGETRHLLSAEVSVRQK